MHFFQTLIQIFQVIFAMNELKFIFKFILSYYSYKLEKMIVENEEKCFTLLFNPYNCLV